ncbi:hypothetical protein [Flavobacterium sp. JP2137]|uniref:hypothetical protein n=1 Tax=Flavobacterium sp. JP2137 TaxID=3414510 RepID=UPI003D30102C
MKDPLKINELQTLPLVVQEKLLEEIRNENIDLIFSVSHPFSPIPQIIVVLNKDINNNRKVKLQESSWRKEVFVTFNIIVTFCNHAIFE